MSKNSVGLRPGLEIKYSVGLGPGRAVSLPGRVVPGLKFRPLQCSNQSMTHTIVTSGGGIKLVRRPSRLVLTLYF